MCSAVFDGEYYFGGIIQLPHATGYFIVATTTAGSVVDQPGNCVPLSPFSLIQSEKTFQQLVLLLAVFLPFILV